MPAYSFMPQFVDPIRARTKGGTIRAPRRAANRGIHSVARQSVGGHAYPGEVLALYCRQRHPRGFLITHAACIDAEPVLLRFDAVVAVLFPIAGRVFHRRAQLDAFARFDGFGDFDEMAAFWQHTHGAPEFAGWHIRWLPLPAELDLLDA